MNIVYIPFFFKSDFDMTVLFNLPSSVLTAETHFPAKAAPKFISKLTIQNCSSDFFDRTRIGAFNTEYLLRKDLLFLKILWGCVVGG